ncbi:MAG: oligoendopeptidase F [candidate division Zixibacteria bacterium]|nr:oligoendopeptidase F [candidate division Zixibacteria bacterium]
MSNSKKIPQRADIDDQHKWNLADLYENDEAWETDYHQVLDLIKSASGFAGRLSESSRTMYECLHTRSELQIILSRLYQYSFLNKDLDNRVSKYQALNERAAALSAQAGAAFSFIEPELLAIDETKLRKMADQFPKTDEYDFYIKELIRSKEHIRSEEVEEVLALSSLVTRGPDAIFSMLDDADIKYPSVKDEDGNDIQLTKQRVVKLLDSADPRVRKDAHEAFYSVYRDHANTLGASLAASVNTDLFYIKTRRYDSCLASSLDGDNIPLDVYHSLIETTEKNLDGLHAYVELRKRLLKLDKIHSYDMFCPLFPNEDYEVSWGDAIRQTLEATAPLGAEYQKNLKAAFDSRWVDVWETEGKGGGAYNSHTYSEHPFVLMNYNNTVDNMFTLAHEMGHSMHSHLTNHTQPFPKSHYSIFVAEVASTLNEGLLLDYLLKKVTDDGQRLYLLNRAIDNAVGTFFNQILYGHFELDIHTEVEKGGALSPDLMTKLWRDLTQKYYGPGITVDDLTPLKWSRIPHFYHSFYVYQYATSFAASQAILSKFLGGDDALIEKYLTMLRAGASDYPIELLKICGIDMSTPAPIEAMLKLFAEQVAEVDRLTK